MEERGGGGGGDCEKRHCNTTADETITCARHLQEITPTVQGNVRICLGESDEEIDSVLVFVSEAEGESNWFTAKLKNAFNAQK